MERLVKKLGSVEQLSLMKQTYLDLLENRVPQGCVYDTADGYLISLIGLGVSEREMRTWLGIGGPKFIRLMR